MGFAGHLGGDFLVFLLVFSPMILLCVESEVVAKARSSIAAEKQAGEACSVEWKTSPLSLGSSSLGRFHAAFPSRCAY